jgi:hypothetical protein
MPEARTTIDTTSKALAGTPKQTVNSVPQHRQEQTGRVNLATIFLAIDSSVDAAEK